MYDVFEQLIQKHNVTPYRVAKEAGVTQTALSNWKSGRSTPSTATLQKIADYFGVSIDYLMTGSDGPKELAPELNARDRRDIAKDLDRIMNEMAIGEDAPLCYNGEPIPEAKLELLRQAIEVALEDAKKRNKVTYRPYKNKPRQKND